MLPFDNLSGEARYERLADGITEDIVTELCAFASCSCVQGRLVALPQDAEAHLTLGMYYQYMNDFARSWPRSSKH